MHFLPERLKFEIALTERSRYRLIDTDSESRQKANTQHAVCCHAG